jgi:hypothetical protein
MYNKIIIYYIANNRFTGSISKSLFGDNNVTRFINLKSVSFSNNFLTGFKYICLIFKTLIIIIIYI